MKPCRKSNGLSSTIQKQNTLTTLLAVHCAYLLTVCRQAGVWTLCLGTPGTWMCPHCDLPNLSWLAAHHLEGHSDSDWACSDTSYKLQSARAPNTQKRKDTCNFTSGQQQYSFLCWWGKRPHMPSAKGHSTEEDAGVTPNIRLPFTPSPQGADMPYELVQKKTDPSGPYTCNW